MIATAVVPPGGGQRARIFLIGELIRCRAGALTSGGSAFGGCAKGVFGRVWFIR